jgi:general stress protein YciG
MTKKERTAREVASLGGKARAKNMSKERRSESARKAALVRWKKKP